jgi:hypothetical protein
MLESFFIDIILDNLLIQHFDFFLHLHVLAF